MLSTVYNENINDVLNGSSKCEKTLPITVVLAKFTSRIDIPNGTEPRVEEKW